MKPRAQDELCDRQPLRPPLRLVPTKRRQRSTVTREERENMRLARRLEYLARAGWWQAERLASVEQARGCMTAVPVLEEALGKLREDRR